MHRRLGRQHQMREFQASGISHHSNLGQFVFFGRAEIYPEECFKNFVNISEIYFFRIGNLN